MAKRKKGLRTVEFIRRYGRTFMLVFSVMFLITVFYGLGSYSLGGRGAVPEEKDKVIQIGKAYSMDTLTFRRLYQDRMYRWRQVLPFAKVSPVQKLAVRKGVIDDAVDTYILSTEAKKKGIKVDRKEMEEVIRQDKSAQTLPVSTTGKEEEKITLVSLIKRWFKKDESQELFMTWVRAEYGSYPKYLESREALILSDKMQARLLEEIRTQQLQEAKKKAEEILEKLQKGEDFATLAKENSDDFSSKNNGGDMGWKKRNALPPEVAEFAFSSPVGTRKLIQSGREGYHIVEILGRKEAKGPDFEKQRLKMKQEILTRKQQSARARGDTSPPEVSDLEIQQEYEEVHLRQILFRVSPEMKLEEKVQELRTQYPVRIYDDYYLYNQMMSQNRLNDAIRTLQTLAEKRPDSPDVYFFLGDAYEKLYMQSSDRTKPEAQENLKKMLENYGKAAEKSEEALEPDAWIYLSLGRAYTFAGQKEKAVEAYKKAADNAGKDSMLLMNIQRQLEFLGQSDLVEQIKIKREAIQKEQQELVAAQRKSAEKAPENQRKNLSETKSEKNQPPATK